MKKYLEDSHANLDQHAIDRLVSGSEPTTEAKPTLAKGLNVRLTLNTVREYLMANPDGFFTSEQIAEQIHLSRITIRRQMNYMVDTGEIISTIDYKTGGRPSIKYGFREKIINRHFLCTPHGSDPAESSVQSVANESDFSGYDNYIIR